VQPPQRKRPRNPDSLALVVPAQKQRHSGMFRDQTIQHISLVAERLRSLQDPEADVLHEVLDELTDYVVDEKVLDRTKIGKDVAGLQKHSDLEVASKAKALIVQWKKDRDTRNKVIKSFREKAELSMHDARKLEEGLFNAACPLGYLEGDGFRSYQRHFLRIQTHLRAQGAGNLRQRLRDGELCPAEVAFQPDEDLQTESQRQKVEADRQAGLQEAMGGGRQPEGTVSSEYMCPRCRGNRTLYKDVQTGWHNDQQDVTILVHCLDCGERWKANDDHGLGGS